MGRLRRRQASQVSASTASQPTETIPTQKARERQRIDTILPSGLSVVKEGPLFRYNRSQVSRRRGKETGE